MNTSDSLVDFLDHYGEAHPPQLLYRDGQDFGLWQKQFRAVIAELIGPLPERIPPSVEILDTFDEPDHTRQLVRITVSEASTLIAYILTPKGIPPDETRPAVLACHGHATFGIDSICGVRKADGDTSPYRAYALHAVQAGYVVMVPAWWGWAGRDGHVDLVGQRDKCNVIQMAAGMYGLNVLALHIQDARVSLDVLQNRPEVDAGRMGCVGNSYGGRTAMWMTVFDERIKACVASGCMNTFRERSLKLSSCAIQYLPGILQYGDVPELFSLIAPRALQLQAGEGDGLITPSDRDAMEATVRKAYALLNAEASFDYVLHSKGHALLWEHATPFLKKYLGGEP